MRRVVITGYGLVSSLGHDVATAFKRLHTLENAVSYSEDLRGYEGLRSHLFSPVADFDPKAIYNRKILRTMGRVAALSLKATEEALAQAGLADSPELKAGRCGVAYGSSFGSIDSTADFYSMIDTRKVKNVTSSTYLKIMPHTTAVNLSVHFGTTGRIIPTGTACTSGSLAVGSSFEAIRHGYQDIMIAGGAEEFSPPDVAIFDTLFATTQKNDSPKLTPRAFDRNRDGLVVGEGAATLILEEREHAIARGATILAEVVGFGTNTDGTHVTQPRAETMAVAMRLALESAQLPADAIGYINAHGTATDLGDIAESTATESVFGGKIPVSTIKSYTGHTLGACGALEAILAIEMMRNNWFSPNLNLEEIDPRCGKLDYIMHEPREFETDHICSNNFAFGGINTSLIFAKA